MTERPTRTAGDIFDAKARRRRDLALLPHEEKVRIVVRLQRMANAMLTASGGTPPRPAWHLPSHDD